MEAGGVEPWLMDRALERIALARDQMANRWYSEPAGPVHAALHLLKELRGRLDLRGEDPYAANLDDLCEYLSRQLAAASLHNQVATLDEVSHLLRAIRSAWSMYV